MMRHRVTPEEDRARDILSKFHRDCICEHEVALIAAAIAEEREACAKIADDCAAHVAAVVIRART